MTNTELNELRVERQRILDSFARAWSRRDIDTLMALVTDDCVYSASVGPEPGQTFIGRDAVREGFLALLAYDSAGKSLEGRAVLFGDVALAEWSYEFRDSAGHVTLIRGCDIMEFSGARICRKDAFRKCHRTASREPLGNPPLSRTGAVV
jgi:ketosteroid isomerase-like protein